MAGLRAGAAYIDVHGRLSKTFDRDIENEAGGRLRETGGKLGGFLAKGMATAGVAAGAALAKGFADSIDAEASSDRVAASFGFTPETQAELGRVAGEVYADAYGESLAEVQAAVANVQASLGELDGDDVADLSRNALAFADIFEVDVNEAIGAASLLLKNNLVADGGEAFDILTATMQRLSPAVRDELIDATKEYSTFFADLGVSGEEAFGLLARAAEEGGNYGVDKMGDALKELTIRATDMSTASVDAYTVAGLSAEEMSARFLAGGDEARGALADLVEGLQGVEDPVARANAAIGLFGTPLEDLSVSEIPTFLDQLAGMDAGLGDVEGAADRAGETLGDNLQTKLESFRREGLQRLASFVGETVVPAVEKMIPVVEDIVATIEERWPAVEAAIRPPVEQIIRTIETNWPKIRRTFEEVVGRVVALVEDKWPRIQRVIEDVLDTVSEVVSGFVELVSVIWDRWGSYIVEFVSSTFDAILRIIEGALSIIRGIVDVVLGILTGDWSRAWDGIKAIVSGAWDVIVGIIELALARAKLILQIGWDLVAGVFSDAWEGIKGLVSDGIDAVVGFFEGLPDRLKAIGSGVFDFLKDAFRDVLNWIIRNWNDFEIKLPSFEGLKVAGQTVIPGWEGPTLGVPDIPEIRAAGGPVLPGHRYLVGEVGPELLTVGSPGYITPNRDLVGTLAGARGGTVTIERVEVTTAVDATADEVVDAIGTKLGWRLTTRNDR